MTETVPGRISSIESRGTTRPVGTGRQDHLVVRILAEDAVEDLAELGGNRHRLVTADETRTRENDRFQQMSRWRIWPIVVRSGPTLPPT